MKLDYLRIASSYVRDAFEIVDRKYFVPDSLRACAYDDVSLPIGHDQSISQPSTVAFMLDLLDPRPEHNILDVGAGSGWTTALLGAISKNVTSVEIIPELVNFGNRNLRKYILYSTDRYPNKHYMKIIHVKDMGYAKNAPYDRILVSASTNSVPVELMLQLADNGIMVIPVNTGIVKVTKITGQRSSEEQFYKETYPGFVFVPLKIINQKRECISQDHKNQRSHG